MVGGRRSVGGRYSELRRSDIVSLADGRWMGRECMMLVDLVPGFFLSPAAAKRGVGLLGRLDWGFGGILGLEVGGHEEFSLCYRMFYTFF